MRLTAQQRGVIRGNVSCWTLSGHHVFWENTANAELATRLPVVIQTPRRAEVMILRAAKGQFGPRHLHPEVLTVLHSGLVLRVRPPLMDQCNSQTNRTDLDGPFC
jgi:hypothetical protein